MLRERLRLHPRGPGSAEQRGEIGAGSDVELLEHVGQVPLDGASCDEEVLRDLAIGQAFDSQLRDATLAGRQRFVAMPRLPEAAVRHLTDIDHHDHEAMIALDEQGTEPLGGACDVRDPERPEAAEIAVTVVDDWQGSGLGTLLLHVISARARDEGVRTFTAWMLARNQEMMDLLQHLGPVRIVDREAGIVEIEVAIPAAGVAPDPPGIGD